MQNRLTVSEFSVHRKMVDSHRTSTGCIEEPTRSGSTTQTETSNEASPTNSPIVEGILHLRSQSASPRLHVHWRDDTIDNENMGKKKSNICCIFHPSGKTDCTHKHEENGGQGEGDNGASCSHKPKGLPEDAWNAYEYQPKYN